MADDEQVEVPVVGAPAPTVKYFKLPEFWSGSVAAWFGVVEAQFALRGVTQQRDRFALVTSALPESSARKVAHLLAAPGETCFDDLRTALLTSHQLTAFEKAEKLFSSEPLGDRRPSALLTEMLELIQPGEEASRLFCLLFLRRLPAAVRLQLTEDAHMEVRALAEKADRCTASLHREPLQAATVSALAACESEEQHEQDGISVNAVGSFRGSSRGRGGGRNRGGQNRGGFSQQLGQQASDDTAPASLAQQQSGLCKLHFRYGRKAFSCKGNCSWQGN